VINVVVIGCGVVGAAIAYELSRVPQLKVTLVDEKPPAAGSTGAALGVLMGVISQKTKGRAWQLRQASLARYESLIPELEALTGITIPFNCQGIVMLRFAEEESEKWEKLTEIRRDRGWNLEIWDLKQLEAKCPQIQNDRVIGAIYSPRDRQVNPTLLTQALAAGAAKNGVVGKFGEKVQKFATSDNIGANLRRCDRVWLGDEAIETDWVVVAAGLGSLPLTASLGRSLFVRPVLGQALHLKLDEVLGDALRQGYRQRTFQPVISGDDIHIVPLANGEYWIGATVEFPDETGEVVAESALLEKVRQEAIAFCPLLANGKVVRSWWGKRPRPEGEAAPVIRPLAGYSNVLLATGHYRNGVLLAPATALAIKEKIQPSLG
jgi:glycine oxidase